MLKRKLGLERARKQWWEQRQSNLMTPMRLTDEQLNRIADLRDVGTPWPKVEAEFNLTQNACHHVIKVIKLRTGRDIARRKSVRKEKPAPETAAPKLTLPPSDHLEYDVATLVRRGCSRQYIAAKTGAKYSLIEAAKRDFDARRHEPTPDSDFKQGEWNR